MRGVKLLASAAAAAVAAVVLAPGGSARPLQNESHDQFRLSGTAQVAQDPDNPTNDVVRIRTDQARFFGTVSRRLGVEIGTLDNELDSWDSFEAAITAAFPMHEVCVGFLVDADEGSPGQRARPTTT